MNATSKPNLNLFGHESIRTKQKTTITTSLQTLHNIPFCHTFILYFCCCCCCHYCCSSCCFEGRGLFCCYRLCVCLFLVLIRLFFDKLQNKSNAEFSEVYGRNVCTSMCLCPSVVFFEARETLATDLWISLEHAVSHAESSQG